MKLKLAVALLVAGLVLAGCAGSRGSRDAPGGGDTPSPVLPRPVQIGDLLLLYMVSETAGWALTGTAVLRTNDGGETWTDVTPESAPARAEILAKSGFQVPKDIFRSNSFM